MVWSDLWLNYRFNARLCIFVISYHFSVIIISAGILVHLFHFSTFCKVPSHQTLGDSSVIQHLITRSILLIKVGVVSPDQWRYSSITAVSVWEHEAMPSLYPLSHSLLIGVWIGALEWEFIDREFISLSVNHIIKGVLQSSLKSEKMTGSSLMSRDFCHVPWMLDAALTCGIC